MSDSVRPHIRQPTKLPCPWDSPGKNTSGLSFPSPVQKSESEVAQSCPTFSDPMDCGPPGSSVYGIFQARVLEWGAIVLLGTNMYVYIRRYASEFLLPSTGLISLQSKGISRVFSNTTVPKASIPQCSAFFTVQLSHPYITTGKTIAFTRRTFVGKVMSLLFNMLSWS